MMDCIEWISVFAFTVNTQEAKLLYMGKNPLLALSKSLPFLEKTSVNLYTNIKARERNIFTQHPQQAYIAKVVSCSAGISKDNRGRLVVS